MHIPCNNAKFYNYEFNYKICFFDLPLSLQYCIIYFVMGLFPEYGADQMILAVRLQTSFTFTSKGWAGTSAIKIVTLINTKLKNDIKEGNF